MALAPSVRSPSILCPEITHKVGLMTAEREPATASVRALTLAARRLNTEAA